MNTERSQSGDFVALAADIRRRAAELGFQGTGIADTDLVAAGARLADWLAAGCHGDMDYMARHGSARSRPAQLVPGTVRVISARMTYWPQAAPAAAVLADGARAYVARYALGRDYHRIVRRRLQRLADHIESRAGPHGYRVFCDSAPVMERALAEKAGLGWIGKHTNLINRADGSWFFIGEIYTDLPLPVDSPASNHCGSCRACLDACPTGAIVAPYRVDARLCIAYLTIELKGSIPLELRAKIGNRVFGCDDCQLVCPWNREANPTDAPDFAVRGGLDRAALLDLFAWSRERYLAQTEGTALRRCGYEGFLRNVAVGLGNAPLDADIDAALAARAADPSALVREHVEWARAHRARRRAPDA